ncbi:MAG: M48 family metallopeptidase [Patescibacteria group bacterium]
MMFFGKKEPKRIEFGESKIPVTIKVRKGSRGVRISIRADDASVVVTHSRFVTQGFIMKFLESKKDWIEEKVAKLQTINPILRTKHSKSEIKKHSIDALALVKSRLEYFNKYHNLEYKKIFIKNQKTKWGSCSSTKNLNFNYKIILLPPHLQDYLVVHELCHLKEFNHSKAFWDLVGEKIPDYKVLSKKLRIGDF